MIEWGEIYAKEGAQLAPSIAPPVEETSMFAGSLMALPQGIKHGWDVAASAVANAAMPVMEKITPETMSAWLDEQRGKANESMKATRTDPRTMGTVGQLIHGVSSVLTEGAMGAAMGPLGVAGAIGGLSMFDKATELMDQGVDLATAQKVGAVTGTVMGVGAALPPFVGGTLTKQIASGIGINVGLGAAERAASGAILEDKYAGIAQHYKAMDSTAMAIDAVLGAAFPIGAKMLRRPTVAQIDDALDANRVVAEQSRDPALQATLEGLERHRAVADDVTRQLLEENRPLGDIQIPANAMDDVVMNEQFGHTAAIAAKAIDDLMVQESGVGVGAVEADIAMLTRAFGKGEADAVQIRGAAEVDVRKQAGNGEKMAEGNATKETAGTRKTEEEIRFKHSQIEEAKTFLRKLADTLTQEQQDAIYRYESALRARDADALMQDPKFVKLLADSVVTLDKDLIVYRGTFAGEGDMSARQSNLFIPTTLDRAWAETMAGAAWSNPQITKIRIKAGDPFIPIGRGRDLNELEILLPQGSKFKQMKTRTFAGDEYVTARGAIDPDDWVRVELEKVSAGKMVVEPSITKPDAEVTTDQFTKQAAQGIIEADPNLKVVNEDGQTVAAKEMLDQAETRFQQEKKEADLYKVAVACAIGVGE